MTQNDCYRDDRQIAPQGIMVHSTAEPGIMAETWYKRWNKSYQAGEMDREVCVHAFLDDHSIYQYLPWNHRGWHAGGKANNTHIGFEICEPAGIEYSDDFTIINYDRRAHEVYFRQAWNRAVFLCAYLCNRYQLTEKAIISHAEGHDLGLASDHKDVGHWFPLHGESMASFRAAVKQALNARTFKDKGGMLC